MDAKTIGRFMDKMSVGIETDKEVMIDIKNNEMNVGLVNSNETLMIHGSMNVILDDMQIPISKYIQFQKSISTFDGIVEFSLEDTKKRLILKGRNTKKIPLCRWSDRADRVIKMVKDKTDTMTPIPLKKREYDIATQDKELYEKLAAVYFIMKDKLLTIQLTDSSGFESETPIDDIDLPDGTYILPTHVFDIMKKSDSLEFCLSDKHAYFKEVANNFDIKYVLTMMKRK